MSDVCEGLQSTGVLIPQSLQIRRLSEASYGSGSVNRMKVRNQDMLIHTQLLFHMETCL